MISISVEQGYRVMISARFSELDCDRLERLQKATGLSRRDVLRKAVAEMGARVLNDGSADGSPNR
jgi:hypothetical protein